MDYYVNNINNYDMRISKKEFLNYLEKFEVDKGLAYHFPKEFVSLIIKLKNYEL